MVAPERRSAPPPSCGKNVPSGAVIAHLGSAPRRAILGTGGAASVRERDAG